MQRTQFLRRSLIITVLVSFSFALWAEEMMIGDSPVIHKPVGSAPTIQDLNAQYGTGSIGFSQYQSRWDEITHPVTVRPDTIAGSDVSLANQTVSPGRSQKQSSVPANSSSIPTPDVTISDPTGLLADPEKAALLSAKKRETVILPGESDYIARAKQGDKDAYRRLVEHYQDRLFGLVLSMVARKEQAEDLTQEIFVKTYFALPKFEGDSSFYTWLFRIASNHCLDYLRKRQPAESSLDSPIEDDEFLTKVQTLTAPATERPEASLEGTSELNSVLASLDPDQSLILSLREIEGYSYEELAEILKCGVNTIKSRLNRAREAFKQTYIQKFCEF